MEGPEGIVSSIHPLSIGIAGEMLVRSIFEACAEGCVVPLNRALHASLSLQLGVFS